MINAGFRPGGRACCLARLEGRNYHLVRLEERNLCVEQKDPKPLTPRPASPDWADAGYGEGEPTRCAHTRPAGSLERPPGGPAAGTGRGGKEVLRAPRRISACAGVLRAFIG